MRIRTMLVSILVLLAVAAAPSTMRASDVAVSVQAGFIDPVGRVDIGFFYNSLAPYGSWTRVARYGEVWVPRVRAGWRPYSDGYWAYTDYGWTWVSDDAWGWAAFHYGRWVFDPAYGWYWVPGAVWGPAWVAWRSGDGWSGWAPLPPEVEFEVGVGFVGGFADFDDLIAPQHWCFVQDRYLVDPAMPRYIDSTARSVVDFRRTRNVTNYTVVNNSVVNNSISVTRVERAAGRPVPRMRIVDVGSPVRASASQLRRGTIPVFRPAIRRSTAPVANSPLGAARASRADHGHRAVAPSQPAVEARPRPRIQQHDTSRTVSQRANPVERSYVRRAAPRQRPSGSQSLNTGVRRFSSSAATSNQAEAGRLHHRSPATAQPPRQATAGRQIAYRQAPLYQHGAPSRVTAGAGQGQAQHARPRQERQPQAKPAQTKSHQQPDNH